MKNNTYGYVKFRILLSTNYIWMTKVKPHLYPRRILKHDYCECFLINFLQATIDYELREGGGTLRIFFLYFDL